jgi:hypothetical protein
MSRATDFRETAWIEGTSSTARTAAGLENRSVGVSVRSVGPDLEVTLDEPLRAVFPGLSDAPRPRVFIATSIPDWPGWKAWSRSAEVPLVTINHAFVGFWHPGAPDPVRLSYRPESFRYGVVLAAIAVTALAVAALVRRRRASVSLPV